MWVSPSWAACWSTPWDSARARSLPSMQETPRRSNRSRPDSPDGPAPLRCRTIRLTPTQGQCTWSPRRSRRRWSLVRRSRWACGGRTPCRRLPAGRILHPARQRRRVLSGNQPARTTGSHRGTVQYPGIESDSDQARVVWDPDATGAMNRIRPRKRYQGAPTRLLIIRFCRATYRCQCPESLFSAVSLRQ